MGKPPVDIEKRTESKLDLEHIQKESLKMEEFHFESEQLPRPESAKGIKKVLTSGQFLSSMMTVLAVGLAFLGVLYYLVNQDYLFRGPKYQDPVTTAPISLYLELTSPDDDSYSTSNTIVVSGKTIPEATVAMISQSDNEVLSANEIGEFSKVFPLDKGLNLITVTSYDNKGNAKSVTIHVYYSSEEIEK